MSADYDHHILLHHLDDPLRILYWTIDEAVLILLVPYLGLAFNHPLLGILLSGGGFYLLRQLKARFGRRSLKPALYWYFPHPKRKLPKMPPSYIREYWG
jgi:conjugal transfer pilus assembly protein TraL